MYTGEIYLIINLSDNSRIHISPYVRGIPYVGQTRTSSEERFKKHKTAARGGRNKTLLYTAMKKDGFEHFTVQTLVRIQCESLAELKQKLDNLESYFAEQYESYSREHVVSYSMINTPGGYNKIPCGTGWGAGRIMTDEDKKALSEAQMGHIVSEQTRKKLRDYNLNNPREWTQEQSDAASKLHTGARRSQETRIAISKAKKGKKRKPEECVAISKAKKGKPFTDTQRTAQANYNEKRFAELFQRHLDNFIKNPPAERQWMYGMRRKKKDGTLDQKYINTLDRTPGFTWSS